MTTLDLIKRLKKCPETAEVFFDDLKGGLIPVDYVRVASPKDKADTGRDAKKPAVILSDSEPLR